MYSPLTGRVGNGSVLVKLECILRSDTPLKFSTREIRLTIDSPSAKIGRASKSNLKNLQATFNNAFFDCAVMSREHARIYLADGLDVSPKCP